MGRVVAVVFFSFLCMIVPAPSAHADPTLTLREVKDHLGTYFNEETSTEKRNEIGNSLKSVDGAMLARLLEEHIKNEKTRPNALALAIELRVPGLLKVVKKYIDGDDADSVVKLLFLTQDKDSLSYLVDLWLKTEHDGLLFVFLNNGFLAHSVDFLSHADTFLGVLKKNAQEPEKAEAALSIMKFQMSFEEDEVELVIKNWKQIRSRFEKYGKHFSIKGIDALSIGKWEFINSSKVGANFRMAADCGMLWEIPEEYWNKDYSLKFWMMPYEKPVNAGVKFVAVSVAQQSTKTDDFVYANGKWEENGPDDMKYTVEMKEDVWTQIEFKFWNAKDPNDKEKISYEIVIGGKKFFQGGTASLPGPVRKMVFSGGNSTLGSTGTTMFGGLEIVLAPNK